MIFFLKITFLFVWLALVTQIELTRILWSFVSFEETEFGRADRCVASGLHIGLFDMSVEDSFDIVLEKKKVPKRYIKLNSCCLQVRLVSSLERKKSFN